MAGGGDAPHIRAMTAPDPTALDRLLKTLDGLAASDDPSGVEQADRAVWDYLSGFDGLSAQTAAADALGAAIESWPVNTSLGPAIRNVVARHRARLAAPSA
ncbi:hypothetical protein MOX02_48050 [Methylobacterium oxalidis]|uniref:Uncharacterized protein n=2 Tax=Methylobacterium oxalidis TaxID=944322 RepID=A0A512J9Z7_9HYPH|nr:hypothetical protein MOX02_48050 [Methylobacterium oxalidis]GJE35585.1 hypothetical protein LDDCCGHA_5804 [Methylobacterium oxalidis]GLS67975.1 hypothetical protein GCM10007888_63600 [Methylobacterium oxalidis]